MNAYELKQHAYASGLKSRALSVLIYLIDRANKDMTCFPAIPTMARQLHISESTVKRALKELEGAGYIVKSTRWRDNGGQSSNLYQLSAPAMTHPETENEQPPAATDNIYAPKTSSQLPERPVQHERRKAKVPYYRTAKALVGIGSCPPWDGASQMSLWTGVGFNLKPP